MILEVFSTLSDSVILWVGLHLDLSTSWEGWLCLHMDIQWGPACQQTLAHSHQTLSMKKKSEKFSNHLLTSYVKQGAGK